MAVQLELRGLAKLLLPTRSRVLLWIEAVLLISGLVIAATVAASLIESSLLSRISINRFNQMRAAFKTQEHEGENELAKAPVALLHNDHLHLHEHADGGASAPLGLVQIPRLNISAPVLEGTDWLTLNHGLGHIVGTARPGEGGNIGIAGHRDTFFRGLKDIRRGDVIELQQSNGTDDYRVESTEVVAPEKVSVLGPRVLPSLTLVTCYPFYFVGNAPKRFIVTASLMTQPDN